MRKNDRNYSKFLMVFLVMLGMGLFNQINAQEFKTISGTVTSEEGKALKGVNLFVPNTAYGSTTDALGNFEMHIPADSKVVVNYIGFTTKTIDASKEADFQLKLQKEEDLQEDTVKLSYANKKNKPRTRIIKIEK